MSIILQTVIVIVCVLMLAYVFYLIANERLLLKYSLLWLILAIVVLISALFPNIVFRISNIFGFVTASNFIIVVGIFCTLALSLSLSVIVSKQSIMIKNLVQRLAIDEHDMSQFCTERKSESTGEFSEKKK